MAHPDPHQSWEPRDRWIAVIPVAVLLLIASVQIYTAHTTELSPWKGGGFGMFSTVDVPTERVVDLYLIIDGEEIPTAIPGAFQGQKASLTPMPTESRTRQMAQALANQSWIDLGEQLPPPLHRFAHHAEPATDRYLIPLGATHDPDRAIEVDAIRLQVFGLGFEPDDRGGGSLYRNPLSDVTVPIDRASSDRDQDS